MSVAAAALTPLLQLRGIETFYGKIQALRGVDILARRLYVIPRK